MNGLSILFLLYLLGIGVAKTIYYLIPDGKGNWVKTDPRIDQEHVTKAKPEPEGVSASIDSAHQILERAEPLRPQATVLSPRSATDQRLQIWISRN